MMRILLLSAALCTLSSLSLAQSSTRARLGEQSVTGPAEGWLPYLGANAGYTRSDVGPNLQEGMPASVKLIGSFYPESVDGVFDIGYGLANQQLTKFQAAHGAVTGADLELAARYKFESRWQAGVVYNTLFDQGPSYGAEQADAQFAGVQVLKEFDIGSQGWLGRVGGRVMTDVNVPGQTVNMAFVDFQIGWNPSSRMQTTRTVAAIPAPRPVFRPAPRPVVHHPVPRAVLPSLMAEIGDRPGIAHFPLMVDKVQPMDSRRVRKLAKVLERRTDLYDHVEVIGHADPTGPESLNQKLSERRALHVRELLVANGWPKNRVAAFGEGERDPLVISKNAPNFGDNRRVEIEFKGVRNERELRRLISKL